MLELPTCFACAPRPDFRGRRRLALLSALGVAIFPFWLRSVGAPAFSPPRRLFKCRIRFFCRLAAWPTVCLIPRARAWSPNRPPVCPPICWLSPTPPSRWNICKLCRKPSSPCPSSAGAADHDAALSPSPAQPPSAQPGARRPARRPAAVPSPEFCEAAEACGFVHEEEALTQALLYRLRTASPDALAALYGMDEGLERRFLAAAQTCASRGSASGFASKPRRYTRARLSRLCAYALLDLSRDFAQAHRAPEYARVLGFRRSAAPLLKSRQAPQRHSARHQGRRF